MKHKKAIVILFLLMTITVLQSQEYLLIEGKNIWIRDKPVTGKVIMKLNTGNKCRVLEKGIKDTIRNNIDYWYKIEFNARQGWVFGSQSNIKTGKIFKPLTFEEALKKLIKAIDEDDLNAIKAFIHPKYGMYQLECPGVYHAYVHYGKIDELYNTEWSGFKGKLEGLSRVYSNNELQKYSFSNDLYCCSDYPGFFYNEHKLKCSALSKNSETMFQIFSFEPTAEEIEEHKKIVQEKISIESKITHQLVIAGTEANEMCEYVYFVSYIFYFLQEADKWYLIIVAPVSNCCFSA